MKHLTEYLMVNTPKRYDFVHLTPKVQALVDKSGVKEGLCLVNSMHITASVFINDHEGGLLSDWQVWLEKLAP
ncbi:MAG TPA: secondary thiamine-phosphate synthase enzyme, partial [Actinobacteria bacterium]|nr:secondary thiamine-phosphate synthase enzyme [Actinomycetota bacterium]